MEFTYPPGSAFIPIANWETKATLSLKNLPSHLSICSSVFLKGWAADVGTLFSFFQLLDHDRLEGTIRNVDDSWAELRLESGQLTRETKITAFMGLKDEKVEITAKEKLPLYFAQSWIRACMSLDTTTGMVRIVVDGKVLEDALHPKIKFFVDKMPTNFTIRVGNAAAINAIFANIDMFLEPPSLDKMVAMTTSGGEGCGARGDFLNWDKAEWTLSDKWANWVLVMNASKVDEILDERAVLEGEQDQGVPARRHPRPEDLKREVAVGGYIGGLEIREVVVRLQRMAEALIILAMIEAWAKPMCTLQNQSWASVQSR